MKMLIENWARTNLELTTGLVFDIYHTPDIDIYQMLQGWLTSIKEDESTTAEEMLAEVNPRSFCTYINKNTGEDSFALTEEQWQEVIPAMYN
jgi:hypothetical protein